MGNNNLVSQEHLCSVDDVAREFIDDILIPSFSSLSKLYPDAQYWNIYIAIYHAFNDYVEIGTFAMVDPELKDDNPSENDFCPNTLGTAVYDVLPKVDQILNADQQKYGITVDKNPLKTEQLTMYTYTKFSGR